MATGKIDTAAAVGRDGTVYVCSRRGDVFAMRPDGTTLWRVSMGTDVLASPVLGPDGTLYVAGNATVSALMADGTARWSAPLDGETHASPALGADGTLYVTTGRRLVAFAPAGGVAWTAILPETAKGSVAVGPDGTVYVGAHDLFAFAPDGAARWRLALGGSVTSGLAFGPPGTRLGGAADRGNIYVGVSRGRADRLVALRDMGARADVVWELGTGGAMQSSPAVDARGTVYVASLDGQLRAVAPVDGSILWMFDAGDRITSSPAIGLGGAIHVGARNGNLYSIGRGPITDVTLSNPAPCLGDGVRVEVSTDDPSAEVSINGLPARAAYLQFQGYAGPRRIAVVSRQGDSIATREIELPVEFCGERRFPVLRATMSHNTPYMVEFEVTTADAFPGPGRRFLWDFGDGVTAETGTPFTRHSYEAELDADRESLPFDVAVTVVRDALEPATGRSTIVIRNDYAVAKRSQKMLQPPVATDGRLTRAGTISSGSFHVRNLETTPIQFTTRRIERHFCDPDRDPVVSRSAVSLTVPALTTSEQLLTLAASTLGREICGVTIQLSGAGPAGTTLFAAAHFDLPHNGPLDTIVNDPATVAQLNTIGAARLVDDPDRIREDDLRVLVQDGRLASLPSREGFPPLPSDSGSHMGDPWLGHVCHPGEPSPRAGLTCQSVADEWTVAPPLVRNALRGDIILTSGCALIGQLLRAVDPPQVYTHEGLMTRNYYDVAECTMNTGFLFEQVDELEGVLIERHLKFGWPGNLRQSVDAAFNGARFVDPLGAIRRIASFSPDAVACSAGEMLTVPMVVRPPPDASPLVRFVLHRAADVASDPTARSHYRVYGYTEGDIINQSEFDSPDGSSACISSQFIWHALSTGGALFEGDASEGAGGEDIDRAAAGSPYEYQDGMYYYSADERLAAGLAVYALAYNQAHMNVYDGCPWFLFGYGPLCLLATDAADNVGNQLTNCFAFDHCSEFAGDSERWRDEPGTGHTVSPDNFLLWDPPATGGVYGHHEPMSYRSAEFRRRHRWAASEGTGEVTGQVLLRGSPVSDPGVRVLLLASGAVLERGLDAGGGFRFPAVPAGSYEVEAQGIMDGDGDGDVELLAVRRTIAVAADATTFVEIDLAIPEVPAGLSVVERIARIEASLVITDDDVGPDDVCTIAVAADCVTSPLHRYGTVRIERCCDEVNVVLDLFCRLDFDDETIILELDHQLYEEVTCGGDDRDGRGGFVNQRVPVDATLSFSSLVRNTDEGGDRSALSFAVTNVAGATITIPSDADPLRRVVTFEGTADLVDNDWPDDDDVGTFSFQRQCSVDRFSPRDTTNWGGTDFCVDEIRAKATWVCELLLDPMMEPTGEVRVTGTYELWEEDSCGEDDLDGSVTRTIVLPACEGGCSSSVLNAFVANIAELGGDSATFRVEATSNVQF